MRFGKESNGANVVEWFVSEPVRQFRIKAKEGKFSDVVASHNMTTATAQAAPNIAFTK